MLRSWDLTIVPSALSSCPCTSRRCCSASSNKRSSRPSKSRKPSSRPNPPRLHHSSHQRHPRGADRPQRHSHTQELRVALARQGLNNPPPTARINTRPTPTITQPYKASSTLVTTVAKALITTCHINNNKVGDRSNPHRPTATSR